jgi:hypothetical protein
MQVSLRRQGHDAELLITQANSFSVIHSQDEETGYGSTTPPTRKESL